MKIRIFGLFCVFLLLSACSSYTRVQKGHDSEAKYELAVKLFNKGEYYKALPLFEELITVYRGTKKAEKTYYYYAYTNYRLEDFETAAYDFDNFSKTYPMSEFAEECSFMHAYCFYESSPEYSLDQSNTIKAINELQLFADRYPKSSRLDQCNTLIDKLRSKLEIKSYEIAELYYNMESYKAAITSYKNLLKDFPSTNFKEDVLFKIVNASYQLAENSYEEKKQERYEDTVRVYAEFVSAFPDSRMLDKAKDLLENAQKKLNKLNQNTAQQNSKK